MLYTQDLLLQTGNPQPIYFAIFESCSVKGLVSMIVCSQYQLVLIIVVKVDRFPVADSNWYKRLV
jgi:hypothetical protein